MKKKLMAALFGVSMGIFGYVGSASAVVDCDLKACWYRPCHSDDLDPGLYYYCLDICCEGP